MEQWNYKQGSSEPEEVRIPLHGDGELPLLKYRALEECGFTEHGFTTRMGGVSEGVLSSLNLGFTRGDEEAAVRENYRRLAEALHARMEDFVLSDQTHTTNVRLVTREDRGKGLTRAKDYHDVDGLITEEPGIVLSTFYADCVPLFFVDPVKKAIGLSHSGWRGTVSRMGRKTLEEMKKHFGTRPEDVVCAIGPSICVECYEVSGDVAEKFRLEFKGHETEILRPGKGNDKAVTKPAGKEDKYQLDLWKANEIVLLESGIRPEHLTVTGLCTCCNSSLLFSHRASHGKRGNLGAFLKIKAE